MRIIGGKDFYDGGLAYGRDEQIAFVRNRHATAEFVKDKDTPLTEKASVLRVRNASYRIDGDDDVQVLRGKKMYGFTLLTVWFAGRRYGGVRVRELDDYWRWSNEQFHFHWKLDAFVRFLATIEIELQVGEVNRQVVDVNSIAHHFQFPGRDDQKEWLITNGIAIAITDHEHGKRGWKFNTDGLKDIGFMRALDTYTAFQELSMFVGGVMARPGKPMVEITDDKVIAAKHGFDNWSFRRMPTR